MSRLDFTNTAAVQAWGAALAASVADLHAAAEDATRSPGRRELGRRAARRLVRETAGALRSLLDHAGFTTSPKRARKART